MKRVICLYRVSTLGQVDHDDIPMQRLACREYAASHPDWEIVDEISEKGVSGYKISTNARDAIVEIKKRAVLHQFDVLLVFMFDRIGRRDDETPFVVQWFVQQGIEVWSAREGEQRFDNHVDKLLNYIRFWQASGESEKTSIRVKTKHSQMVQEGIYRGGLIPYGYKLVDKGRMNKRNKPVKDLIIDEGEAKIVREIFHLLVEEGYGTNRVAQRLNDMGIKTKRGTSLWRGTSIRALIDNPIYIGIYHMEGVQSEPLEQFRIIDDAMFERCQQTVKGRSTRNFGGNTPVPVKTSSRCLLTGILYCADCGCRMTFAHNATKRKLADGTIKVYERDMYRCYRKISSRRTCAGQSSYDMRLIDPAVEAEVRRFLVRLGQRPREELLDVASARNTEMYQVAYDQAEKDFENAQKQVSALEEEAVKALTGESQLDLSVVNAMLVKHRARLETAQQAMVDAQAKLEAETQSAKETKAQIDELLSWADCFDKANTETKHMIMARLIDRVELAEGYKVHIRFKISMDQFQGVQVNTQ